MHEVESKVAILKFLGYLEDEERGYDRFSLQWLDWGCNLEDSSF